MFKNHPSCRSFDEAITQLKTFEKLNEEVKLKISLF